MEEAQVEPPQQSEQEKGARTDVLEKKWVSVVRLKKQSLDLEKQLKQLKENAVCERCEAMPDSLGGLAKMGDGIPREPEKYALPGHRGKVTKVVLHPFYNIAASASEDATIRLWDYEQGESERTLKGHAGIVNFLAFNGNGSLLASCASDLAIKLWNLKTFSCQKTIMGHEHEVSGLCFLPVSDYLISVSRDCSVRLWDPQSGHCLTHLTKGHTDWVKRAAATPSGKYFATSSKDQTIVVWTTDTVLQKQGRVDPIVAVLNEHEHVIDCIVWAPLESARTIEFADYSGGLYSQAST